MNSFIININNKNFNYNNKNILKEIGYNVLSDNDQIKKPDIKENRSNIYYINNNDLNNKIRNKDMLTEENIYIIPNSGSGNCFYKTASQFFNNKESYHYYYRQKNAEYIFNKINEDYKKYPYIYYNDNKIPTYMKNFNNLIMT